MFECLSTFESEIMRPLSLETVDLHSALNLVESECVMPTEMAVMNRQTHSKLCQLLTVYKLVDILHAIDQPSTVTSGHNPKYLRLPGYGIPGKNAACSPRLCFLDVIFSFSVSIGP